MASNHSVDEWQSAGARSSEPGLSGLPNSTPRSPPLKRMQSSPSPGPATSHRQSYVENLRGVPPSPRSQRHPSFSQQALQELLNNPPVRKSGDMELAGRDWRTVQVHEVVDTEQVRFVEMDTSVEDATNVLIATGAPNLVLLRETKDSRVAIGTFDYSDLNAYLLLVVGLAHPDEKSVSSFNELARKGREGKSIPLKDVKDLGRKEPLITLPHSASLAKAVEIFGSGIHRIVVVDEHTMDVVGVLSQLRLVAFFWENGRDFPSIDELFPQALHSLNLGSHSVVAINGDKHLAAALELMNNESITSLPVLDQHHNVLGNISHVDVRLLTKTTSLPLLRSSCAHFISVILSERGVNEGQDPFPVFYVNPHSTLAHTVAKLVATRSHRMWIVEEQSPASSGPPTPSTSSAVLSPPFAHTAPLPPHHVPSAVHTGGSGGGGSTAPPPPAPSVSAPGAILSGRLSGVVSLTDILNLFARASGLRPHDPDETRRQRRRSSSSSVRRSVDSARSSSADLSRSGSLSAGHGGRRK